MVRHIHPSRILIKVINPLVARLGTAATLTVRTGVTGKDQRRPVRLLETGGRRYVVAVRADARWFRNLRSAGSCELRHRGWVQRFALVEVPPAERPPLIAQYRARQSARTSRFAVLLDSADHPIFELRTHPQHPPG
jgi:hypothetical protein